mmetsp:Transcript_118913/g.341635  ORF Transcript_118913/g.341635 Transcript_118913/m.341635 type:complete len:85 (+) Transcript_118913:791-1045(+)
MPFDSDTPRQVGPQAGHQGMLPQSAMSNRWVSEQRTDQTEFHQMSDSTGAAVRLRVGALAVCSAMGRRLSRVGAISDMERRASA